MPAVSFDSNGCLHDQSFTERYLKLDFDLAKVEQSIVTEEETDVSRASLTATPSDGRAVAIDEYSTL